MTRFEIAPEWVAELMWRVCAEYRPGLLENDAQILVLFDLKPRKSQGRFVFGRLAKAKDELKVIAQLAEKPAYDYVLYLDKILFTRMDHQDRATLIRHELDHALGHQPEDGPIEWRIQGHHYEVFRWEVEPPDWQNRFARWGEMAASLHDSKAPLPAELPPTGHWEPEKTLEEMAAAIEEHMNQNLPPSVDSIKVTVGPGEAKRALETIDRQLAEKAQAVAETMDAIEENLAEKEEGEK